MTQLEKIKAIIIDDESHCRSSLQKQLEWYCPQIMVEGEAEDIVSGLSLIKKTNPTVVFLDIKMPGGTGFDLIQQIPDVNFQIIFTTAYDEYAIKAFEVNALSYLLKPIGKDDLIKAVAKIPDENPDSFSKKLTSLMSELKAEGSMLTKVALPVSDGLQFVNIDDITRCESEGSYCKVFLKSGHMHLLSKTLKQVSELISHKKFIRVHHSHLVNMDYVDRYIRGSGGQIILEGGISIPVSRNKKDSFLERF